MHIKKLNLCRKVLTDDLVVTSAFTKSFLFSFLQYSSKFRMICGKVILIGNQPTSNLKGTILSGWGMQAGQGSYCKKQEKMQKKAKKLNKRKPPTLSTIRSALWFVHCIPGHSEACGQGCNYLCPVLPGREFGWTWYFDLPGLKWGKEWTPGHVSSFGVPSTCAQKEKRKKTTHCCNGKDVTSHSIA